MKIINEIQVFKLLGAVNLKSAFGLRDHAMIRFALQTGLRVGELSALNVHHVAAAGQARRYLDLPAGLTVIDRPKGSSERSFDRIHPRGSGDLRSFDRIHPNRLERSFEGIQAG